MSLQGSHSLHVPHKFSGFLLVAEQEGLVEDGIGGVGLPPPGAAGSFALYGDALTKFSDRCPNAVTQTSSMPKSEIQVTSYKINFNKHDSFTPKSKIQVINCNGYK